MLTKPDGPCPRREAGRNPEWQLSAFTAFWTFRFKRLGNLRDMQPIWGVQLHCNLAGEHLTNPRLRASMPAP